MVRAYVTILTSSGAAREALEAIRDTEEVSQADIVAGEFDIVAEVEAESERDLLSLITDEIQTIEGVGRTSTCIVLE